jgi:hypothetical protein
MIQPVIRLEVPFSRVVVAMIPPFIVAAQLMVTQLCLKRTILSVIAIPKRTFLHDAPAFANLVLAAVAGICAVKRHLPACAPQTIEPDCD